MNSNAIGAQFFCPFLFPCIHKYIFVSRVARTRLNIVSKCFFPDLFSVCCTCTVSFVDMCPFFFRYCCCCYSIKAISTTLLMSPLSSIQIESESGNYKMVFHCWKTDITLKRSPDGIRGLPMHNTFRGKLIHISAPQQWNKHQNDGRRHFINHSEEGFFGDSPSFVFNVQNIGLRSERETEKKEHLVRGPGLDLICWIKCYLYALNQPETENTKNIQSVR